MPVSVPSSSPTTSPHQASPAWLSLSACISRILEQWKALHLYFQLAHTEDRLHSSDFLYRELSNPYTHLYFQFLEYVLSMTDKLNIMFQSPHAMIHRVVKDCLQLYIQILSCFIKPSVLKVPPQEVISLDPKDPNIHLPLTQIRIWWGQICQAAWE